MKTTQQLTKQNKLVRAKNAQEKTLQVFRENLNLTFNLTSFNKLKKELKDFDKLLVEHFQKKHPSSAAQAESEQLLKQNFNEKLGALKGKVNFDDYVFMFENRGFFSALGKSHSLNTDLIKELYRDLDAVETMHKVQPPSINPDEITRLDQSPTKDVGSLENTILLPEKIYGKFNAKGANGANKISLAVWEAQNRVHDFKNKVSDGKEQIKLVQESLNKLTGAFNDKLEIELSTLPSLVEETLFIKGCLDHWESQNSLNDNIKGLKINPDALMSIYRYLNLPRQEEPARKSIFSFENRQTPLGGMFPAASALKTLWEHANEKNSIVYNEERIWPNNITDKSSDYQRQAKVFSEGMKVKFENSLRERTGNPKKNTLFTAPTPASVSKIDKTLLRKKAIDTFIKAQSSDRAKVIKELKLFNKKLVKCLKAKDSVDNLQKEYDKDFKEFTGLELADYKLLFEHRDNVMRFFQLYSENTATIKSMFNRWEIIANFKELNLITKNAGEAIKQTKAQLPAQIHKKFETQIKDEVAKVKSAKINLNRAQDAMNELNSCFDNYAQIRPQTLPLLVKNTLILNAYINFTKRNIEMTTFEEGQKFPVEEDQDDTKDIYNIKDDDDDDDEIRSNARQEVQEYLDGDDDDDDDDEKKPRSVKKKSNSLDINSYVLRKVQEYLDGIFSNTLPQTESLKQICLAEKSGTLSKNSGIREEEDPSEIYSNEGKSPTGSISTEGHNYDDF